MVRRSQVTDTPLLELRNITKSFGSVQALDGVDFEVRRGEIMALVGDNGAGKSTLIKCVAGMHASDSGEILFEGQEVHIHGPKDAARLGIEVVYQDLASGRQSRRRPEHVPRPRAQPLPDPQRGGDGAEHDCDPQVARGHDDQVGAPAGRDALRRSAAVGRGREGGAVELEPRDPRRADRGARRRADGAGAGLVRRLGEQGLAVVLISHNLHDVFETADRITVLRLGRSIGVFARRETTQQQVVEAITAGMPTKVAGIPPAAVEE